LAPSAAVRRLIAAAALLCACQNPVGVDTQQRATVVLVPFDARDFSPDATLVAQVWTAEQLDALAKNASCSARRDSATGATTIQCPPGVVYREVSPQKFEISVRDASSRLEIAPMGVRAGERFRIRVSGPSADRCNTTSGDETVTAGAESTMQVNLTWVTTAKACGGDAR
jgi:hypothetical protein